MQPLVVLSRSGYIESIHQGYICVVNNNNQVIAQLGDSSTKIFLRSAAKPFQALATVHSGAADYYHISDQELAIMCSSHSGQAVHRDTVGSILNKIGLDEHHLDCGVTNPYNQDTNEWLIRHNEKPTKLYNCCSGKHAGMLMLCRFYNFSTNDYCQRDHPVQKLIFSILAELLNCLPEIIIQGDDGCGVPNCLLTVHQAAYLYALLAEAGGDNKFGHDLMRIRNAMRANPLMINGDGEFCTDLIRQSAGRVVGKVGSEGVYCVSVVEKKLGICIKILDGNERAVYPAAIHALQQLGILDKPTIMQMKKWSMPLVKDHKGKTVGYTVPIFDLYDNSSSNLIKTGDKYLFGGEMF